MVRFLIKGRINKSGNKNLTRTRMTKDHQHFSSMLNLIAVPNDDEDSKAVELGAFACRVFLDGGGGDPWMNIS